jgi:hypothetical protein
MATVGFDLAQNSWTDLGTTPCFVQCVGDDALVVIDTVTPGTLGADAHVLRSDGDSSMDIGLTGQHAYARGIGGTGRIIVSR